MTPQEARKELARRELARRQQAQPVSAPHTPAQGGLGNTLALSTGSTINNALNSATLGGYDHLRAGVASLIPSNAAAGGADVRFGDYAGNLKKLRAQGKAVDEQVPLAAGASKIAGAIAGVGKAQAMGALPSAMIKGQGLGKSTLALGADGAVIAGVESALSGGDVGKDAVQGGLLGAGLNMATRGVGGVLGQFTKPIMAHLDPKGAAQDTMRKALERSGQSVDDFTAKMRGAADDGNSSFAAMDALGLEGQRLASTVARTPSTGRAKLTEFLDARQAGQGGRIGVGLSDALGGQRTADEAYNALDNLRRSTDTKNFGAIPDQPVNIGETLKQLRSGLTGTKMGLKPTKAERALEKVQKQLVSGQSSSVSSKRLARVRREIEDDISRAFDSMNAGNKAVGTDLLPIKKQLTDDLVATHPAFAAANKVSSQNARIRDAVRTGQRDAAPSVRAQDALGRFNGLDAAQAASYRTGFVDPLLRKVEGAAIGADKSRPLINDKMTPLLGRLSTDGGKLTRNLEREQQMFATRAAATGGSRTADNLADMQGGLQTLGSAARGDIGGAIMSLARQGANAINGQPASVRAELADYLMTTSPDRTVQAIAQRIQRGEKITQAQTDLIRSSVAAISVSGSP